VWVASQVSELLAAQSALALSGPACAKEFLKQYCAQQGCSMLQVSKRANLTPSALSTFIKEPGRRMELDAFIRIAAAEGLSLVGILRGSGASATARAASNTLERRQPSSVRGRSWQQIGAKAPLALAAGHGLASWAKELGVPPRSLVMRLPEACAALTAQKQARRVSERHERMRRMVAECEAIAADRWADKGVVSPLSRHQGKRLNGERPLILKSLELLLSGNCVDAAWPPEVEQLIVEAADRILASYAVRRACF
jgi:transcriptional regulator with XRE-family HTH domain